MQVFVPYPDIIRSVSCLDPSRLGNQVYREILTLIRGGWPHHPAAKMWVNHKHALAQYALAGLDELKRRGRDYPHHRVTFEIYLDVFPDTGMPPWWGREDVHRSHASNLIRKRPSHYAPLFPGVPPDLPYVWR
jgi:hypothetical protein